MNVLVSIFGEGKDLTIYQMSARAIVIYFVALVLIRISGRRTFGKHSAFDNVIAIILGAILSRAVVGASPFAATIICSLALVVLHRLLAMLCIYSETLSHIVKGQSMSLYKNSKIEEDNLKASLMTRNDLMADLRLRGQVQTLHEVEEVVMETSGEVSVVKKKKN
ncbi:DUF421 domain-containing protein [Mucilaginibacter sp. AW1-3]